jgi:hypothetical protein
VLPQRRSGRFGEEVNLVPLPVFEPRFLVVQPTFHGPIVFLKHVSSTIDFSLHMLHIKANLVQLFLLTFAFLVVIFQRLSRVD